MTPIELARELVAQLEMRGISAAMGEGVPFGHKVSLNDGHGGFLGSVVVYVGKHGPKRSDELRASGRGLTPTIDDAWRAVSGQPREQRQSATSSRDEGDVASYGAQLAEIADRVARYAEDPSLDVSTLRDAIIELAGRQGVTVDQELIAESGVVMWQHLVAIARVAAAQGRE